MCIAIICFPVCDIIKFEAVFLHNQKSQNKNLNIFRMERGF